jgi:hypothetical protein
MQHVLAWCFEAAGFQVVENAVGVPDFTAHSPPSAVKSEYFAVEVKTTDKTRISLAQRELDAIRTTGQTGILAILEFPSMNPGWLLKSADGLAARTLELRHLRLRPQVELIFDVDGIFRDAVSGLEVQSIVRGPALKGWISSQRGMFLSRVAQRSELADRGR